MNTTISFDKMYTLGFLDQMNERTNEKAVCKGIIPDWLRGSLFRNGPGRFQLPDGPAIRHWFDGFAMIHRFNFADDGVYYTNRFLKTNYYKESLKKGRMAGEGFAGWRISPIEKLQSVLHPRPGDNADVHIHKLGKELVALTEVTQPVAFDPVTLDTRGTVPFDDDFKAPMMLAHVHRDPFTGGWLNYMVEFGRMSYYHLFRIRPGETRREIIASLPVQKPAYMHSFSVTEHYAILAEPPFRMNPLLYLMGRNSFADSLQWEADHASTFHIIDLQSGKEQKLFGPPFFSYHHVNAFEEGNTIVLDLIAYPDAFVVQAQQMNQITNLPSAELPPSLLERFTLDLMNNKVTSRLMSETWMELPRINYGKYNGKPYRYGYAAITSRNTFLDGLAKWDVESGHEWTYHVAGVFPSEPIFVPNPSGKSEDDGVILSVALIGDLEKSALLILDAQSFTELARVEISQIIPYGFHGLFLPEKSE